MAALPFGRAQAQDPPELAVPITVSTDAGNALDLTLGLDPTATAGIDASLGESEQPPTPPSGVFDARWVDNDISATGFGEGLLVDIRPGDNAFAGTRAHELQLQPGSGASAITIAWNLPAGATGRLVDVVSQGDLVDAPMSGTDTYTLTNLNVSKLFVTIDYDGPPTATDDAYSTLEDQTLTVAAPGVLSNDSDPDGDALTASVVSGPSNGALTLNEDGSFTYVPDTNVSGSDSFTYEITDGITTTQAVATLTVDPVNDPPQAADDTYATPEDQTLTVAAPGVLGNDSDVEGSPLSASVVQPPDHGTLTLGSDGAFEYVPDANFAGADSFTYAATDGSLTGEASVTLTVTSVNDAPVASDDAFGIPEGQTLRVAAPGVLGNDTDADGDAGTASVVSGPSNGTLSLNADGSFAYTPAADFSGADTFTYAVSDGQGGSDQAQVDLTVCRAAWTLALTGTDSNNAASTAILGRSATATTGLDPSCGETEQPAPADSFALRFTDTGLSGVDLGAGTPIDLRPDSTSDPLNATITWRVEIPAATGFPLSLSWDEAALQQALPVRTARLVDVGTGGDNVDVDMKATGSTTISSTAVSALHVQVALPVSWSLQMTATDNAGASEVLSLGQSPAATAGLDTTFGESERPPTPPSDVFDVRFTGTGLSDVDLGEGSFVDLRPDGAETGLQAKAAASAPAVWRIEFQGAGAPFTFGWDAAALSAALPDTPVRLVDALTGGDVVSADMKATGTVTVTNTSVTALEIQLDQQITRSVPLEDGWTLASIPVDAPDPSFGALLPSCNSGFFFASGQGFVAIEDTTLVGPGRGFFANCTGGTVEVTGQDPGTPLIDVAGGWNIVGAFAQPVPVSAITSEPSGIVETDFFAFTQGYQPVDSLRPGRGYWVKVSQAGTLDVSSAGATAAATAHPTSAEAASARLVLTDATNRSATLHLYPATSGGKADHSVLPPTPPRPIFDARFTDGTAATTLSASGGAPADAPAVQVQGATFPLTLRLEGPEASTPSLRVWADGRSLPLTTETPATLARATSQFRIAADTAPATLSLGTVRPHPVSERAVLDYTLPTQTEVTIEVYDLLGRRVAQLVDGPRTAGRHEVALSAGRWPSGTYFVRMQAGSASKTQRLTVVR